MVGPGHAIEIHFTHAPTCAKSKLDRFTVPIVVLVIEVVVIIVAVAVIDWPLRFVCLVFRSSHKEIAIIINHLITPSITDQNMRSGMTTNTCSLQERSRVGRVLSMCGNLE